MDMNVEDWDALAPWYTEQIGDDGDFWHRTLIDPTVLRVLGPVDGQRVFDLACGGGYLSRRLARLGAQVTGVDASAPMLARAAERERAEPLGIRYQRADAARLDMLEDGSFDVVLCNMALMDIGDAEGAIREVGRVLVTGGRFVASICHPCFDVVGASAWVVEQPNTEIKTTVWRKVSRYRDISWDWVPWRTGAKTRGYHRPLSWYFRALRAAGLAVTALEEPEPTEEFLQQSPQGAWIQQIPMHCVFEALKLTHR